MDFKTYICFFFLYTNISFWLRCQIAVISVPSQTEVLQNLIDFWEIYKDRRIRMFKLLWKLQ